MVMLNSIDGSNRSLVSLRSVDAMTHAVENVQPIENERPFAPSSLIHTKRSMLDGACIICEEALRGESGIAVKPTIADSGLREPVAVHEHCCKELAEALRGVWEHTDDMLTENL